MTKPASLAAAAMVCISLLLASAAPGAVSLEDLRKLAVDAPLPPAATRFIDEYGDQLAEQLKSAKDHAVMVKVRQAVQDGYQAHASTFYQLEYAKSVAERLTTVLSVNDPVKQIQAAMAIAAMPQYSVQPALEAVARSPNPAVRHWAVRGYRGIARLLFRQGGDYARKMLATLETVGLKDSSGAVVGDVLAALNPLPEATKDQNAQLRALQDKVLLARCADLRAGREDMPEAYRRAAASLMSQDSADSKLILQMLTDVLEAGSQAFFKADQNEALGQALMDLLNTVETRLVEATSTSQSPIQTVLSNEKLSLSDKEKWARLKVLEYWNGVLADRGVKTRVAPAGATTPPATAPAASGPAKTTQP